MNEENSLAHFGVKGMSWYSHQFGKWQPQAAYAGGQPDPNAKTKIKTTTNDIVKGMSIDDLRSKTNRLNAENNYLQALSTRSRLNAEFERANKSSAEKNLNAVKRMGGDILSSSVRRVGTNAVLLGVGAAISKKFGPEIAKAIIGGKKK